LKHYGFKADQVQNFYPSPMATATAMYYTGKNPLKRIGRDSENVSVAKSAKQRRLHKAFLRYHDQNNWPMLRDALKSMGRADLIGNGKQHLIPAWQPRTDGSYRSARRKNSTGSGSGIGKADKARVVSGVGNNSGDSGRNGQPRPGRLLTQHTGLPPRKGS
jgi:hypothetical protein